MTIALIDSKVKTLKDRLASLDGKLVSQNGGVVDLAVSDAMMVIDKKLAALNQLRAQALAGTAVSEDEIAVACGEKSAAPPAPPVTVLLPADITTSAERKGVSEKRRTAAARSPMSAIQRDILNEFRGDAIAYIEGSLENYKDAAGERTAVAFTQDLHTALTLMLAELWADLKTVAQFNRRERLALEKRIAELEARPAMSYRGTWEAGRKYVPGDFTTDGGSLWHAEIATQAKPGTNDNWKLAVKRGRDGKDAR